MIIPSDLKGAGLSALLKARRVLLALITAMMMGDQVLLHRIPTTICQFSLSTPYSKEKSCKSLERSSKTENHLTKT
jgi:hypothetical protein